MTLHLHGPTLAKKICLYYPKFDSHMTNEPRLGHQGSQGRQLTHRLIALWL